MRQLCLISPLALLVELQTLLLQVDKGFSRSGPSPYYGSVQLYRIEEAVGRGSRANSSQSAAPQSQQPASCSRSASEEVQSVSSSRSVGSTTANRQLHLSTAPLSTDPFAHHER